MIKSCSFQINHLCSLQARRGFSRTYGQFRPYKRASKSSNIATTLQEVLLDVDAPLACMQLLFLFCFCIFSNRIEVDVTKLLLG